MSLSINLVKKAVIASPDLVARNAHQSKALAETSLKIETTSLHPYVAEAVDGREGGSYLFKEEMKQEASSLKSVYQINLHCSLKHL